MRIALFGKEFSSDFNESIKEMLKTFSVYKAEIIIEERFAAELAKANIDAGFPDMIFKQQEGLPENIDVLISMGGDGTFLETVRLVKDKQIPILGVNTGRLGFLANISREEIQDSIRLLLDGNFSTEERSLIKLTTSYDPLDNFNKALNEITIHKKGSGMISIHTELNDEFLNSYWADGLIISTPTGSTAYSMSVGGPIMLPQSKNFIISPVSPHNLTVRPIVVPDNMRIKIKVHSRSDEFLIALDSRSFVVGNDIEIEILRAEWGIQMVKFPINNFYNTLRNKLMWGMDKRN